jgi:hypothetical protein
MLYPKDFRSYYVNPDTLRISRAQFIQEMETEQWDYKMHYSIDISSQEKTGAEYVWREVKCGIYKKRILWKNGKVIFAT